MAAPIVLILAIIGYVLVLKIELHLKRINYRPGDYVTYKRGQWSDTARIIDIKDNYVTLRYMGDIVTVKKSQIF